MNARGISLTELIVVMGMIGVLGAVGIPFLLTYWQSSTLTSGAQELQTILNNARQVAIRRNQQVCAERTGSRIQYRLAGCTGNFLNRTGGGGNAGDPADPITLANDVQVTNATANVVFTSLGAASTAGTYTVQAPGNAQTLTVTVAASGRVTIP